MYKKMTTDNRKDVDKPLRDECIYFKVEIEMTLGMCWWVREREEGSVCVENDWNNGNPQSDFELDISLRK